MNPSDKQSLQKTLLFAATVTALGSALGVSVQQALAASPSGEPAQVSASNASALQAKMLKNHRYGANQFKLEKSRQVGANQLKLDKNHTLGAQQLKMDKLKTLNAGNKQLPAVQK